MTTFTASTAAPTPSPEIAAKVKKLQELFADAPEVAKVALANMKRSGALAATAHGGLPQESAGYLGKRHGRVSEFTVIAPFTKGGAERLRAVLSTLDGSITAEMVGSVHEKRYVFLDNDTKLLVVTSYDGDWESYIGDFATKVPDSVDLLFSAVEGWPGIRNPAVKEWLAQHQVTAEDWWVCAPKLSVADTRRLQKISGAVDEFLDKVNP